MKLSIDLKSLMLHHEFKTFLEYLKLMESFLFAESKKEEEFFQELMSKSDPEAIIDITNTGFFPGRIDDFSEFLRNSFFVSLYSFFENQLINECRSRKSDDLLIEYKDIRGVDEIERVMKYFTKVLRIDFPSNTPEWQEIQCYRLIRNCIVHAQGKVYELKGEKEQSKLRGYVEKKGNLTFAEHTEKLYLKEGFCEEACNTIERFLMMKLYPLAFPKEGA